MEQKDAGDARGAAPARPHVRPEGPGARSGRIEYADTETYASEGPPPWFEMTATGPERGPCVLEYLRCDHGSLTFGEECGPNVGHARVPEFATVFLLWLDGAPPPLFQGVPLTRSRVAVLGPGSDQVEAIRAAGRWVRLAAATEAVRRAAAGLGLLDAPPAAGRSHVVAVAAAEADALRHSLDAVLSTIRSAPEEFADDAERERTFRGLLDAFVRAAAGRIVPGSRPEAAAEHERILLACLSHLESSRTRMVTVTGLCAAAATSQRTLTRVFRESFDLSPARYLRLRRLNQVRSHLRRAQPRPLSVREAARLYGFRQLGRFAGAYRRLFGELPSRTLERRGPL